MVYQPGMVPTWLASQPSVPDFSCGFQFHFSLGMRSSTLRVLAISWSNSGSKDCAMDIGGPPRGMSAARRDYRRIKGEFKAKVDLCSSFELKKAAAALPLSKVECAYGTRTHGLVPERLAFAVSVLQKAG